MQRRAGLAQLLVNGIRWTAEHVRLVRMLRARVEAMTVDVLDDGGVREGGVGVFTKSRKRVGASKQAQMRWRRRPPARTRALCRVSQDLPFSVPSVRTMSSDLVLPGQPIPLPRGPVPQLGNGIYSRDGLVRASLVGVPSYEGSVRLPLVSCLAA